MSAKGFRQSAEYQRGHWAERLVLAYLQSVEGWFCIPSYDFCGQDEEKAPRLQGRKESHVLPDLDMSRRGVRRWGEVKFKSTATWHRNTQKWEHGIPRRHFDDYLKVQEITGCKVWLYVFQEDSEHLLYASLDRLLDHARFYHENKMSRGGMAFFPLDKFRVEREFRLTLEEAS